MRIAHVTDFYLPRLGGIEMQVAELAGRQRAAGHEVHVITSSPSAGKPEDLGGHTQTGWPWGPDRVIRLTDHLRKPRAIHPAAWVGVGKAVREGGYDVVHCHVGVGSPTGFLAARAATRAGIPTVITVHSLWQWVITLFKVCNIFFKLRNAPVAWTAVSDRAARSVRKVLPDGATVHVVPNGIDPARWAPRPDGPTRQDNPRELRIAAVMRLAGRKRPIPLLKMVRDAQAAAGDGVVIRLDIAGCGEAEATMRRFMARHGLTDQVTLRGRLNAAEVRDFLATSDAFIAPANLESFGLAALEARCAGLPIIAKASGGLPEFIMNGREGLICETDGDMSAALIRLSHDRDLLHRMQHHNAVTDCAVIWPNTLTLLAGVYEAAGAGEVDLLPPVDLSELLPQGTGQARR